MLSYSKPFHNTLHYASIANIEKVMKFYNPGDKTFETDLSSLQDEDEHLALHQYRLGKLHKPSKFLIRSTARLEVPMIYLETSRTIKGSSCYGPFFLTKLNFIH